MTGHFRGIDRIYPNLIKENRRISTCNRLDFANARISTDYVQKSPRSLLIHHHSTTAGRQMVIRIRETRIVCLCTRPLIDLQLVSRHVFLPPPSLHLSSPSAPSSSCCSICVWATDGTPTMKLVFGDSCGFTATMYGHGV